MGKFWGNVASGVLTIAIYEALQWSVSPEPIILGDNNTDNSSKATTEDVMQVTTQNWCGMDQEVLITIPDDEGISDLYTIKETREDGKVVSIVIYENDGDDKAKIKSPDKEVLDVLEIE